MSRTIALVLLVGCASSAATQVVDPNDTASNTVQGGLDLVGVGFTACAVIDPCASLFKVKPTPPSAPSATSALSCGQAPWLGEGVIVCQGPMEAHKDEPRKCRPEDAVDAGMFSVCP